MGRVDKQLLVRFRYKSVNVLAAEKGQKRKEWVRVRHGDVATYQQPMFNSLPIVFSGWQSYWFGH